MNRATRDKLVSGTAAAATHLTVPYTPGPFSVFCIALLDRHRFVVAVCHRRFGKSVLAVNQFRRGR